ncbi:MAG: ribosomal protein [Phycisphaerales bacterium]|nr:ribosomal protein [Phycisphaerales bacterium]
MDNPESTSSQRERDPRDREPRDRISSFEQMKVWQEAHALVLRIFEMTPRIPAEQQEGLAALMEKAAIEVPKSIAEGFKRRGSRNKAHYYNLSQSALESLRYLLILCRDLKYDIDYEDLAYRGDQVSRMLDGLIRSMTRTGGGGRGGSGGGRRGGRNDSNRRNRDDVGDGPSSQDNDDNEDWDDEG